MQMLINLFVILDVVHNDLYLSSSSELCCVSTARLSQCVSQCSSVRSSGASASVSASPRLLFVCSYMEIEFFICPLKVPQGNHSYIIAGNTLSASSFCPPKSPSRSNIQTVMQLSF